MSKKCWNISVVSRGRNRLNYWLKAYQEQQEGNYTYGERILAELNNPLPPKLVTKHEHFEYFIFTPSYNTLVVQ